MSEHTLFVEADPVAEKRRKRNAILLRTALVIVLVAAAFAAYHYGYPLIKN